ncbi:MAG TPA: GAF domain-containing protein [Solirubrobacteraceae bacterium]|nr:GAF domain-containing protein [Solirubrobacteraceae bacterium]
MSNPWLAIDVATAPAQRAREVRRAWERFVSGGSDRAKRGDGVPMRAPIEDSWRRSAAAGVDPSGVRIAPIVADADETTARWEIHPLAETAPLIRACLAASADESRHLIVVSDANGILLWVEGNPSVRLQAADSMNFAEGTLWSEGGAGTNAIGTALAAEHAVQVFASEHFNEIVQSWTCAAAPVHDPDTGQVIGVIDLTGEMATVHPHSMAVATATAQAVEAHLRCDMLDRDGRLLSRYGDQLTAGPGPRALIAPSGRVIASQPIGWLAVDRLTLPPGGGPVKLSGGMAVAEALGREDAYLLRATPAPVPNGVPAPVLSLTLLGRDGQAKLSGHQIPLRPRHAEILTLLCANPEGMTSEQLAEGVYGDSTRAGGIRVEISRLRKLLGDVVDTEQYRLRAGVLSDVAQVCGLLHRGRVREAATRYPGPLLPRSRAPGVVHEREALERWMRQSVMSAGDQDALWAWLQTTSGTTDLSAWQRLLANLPFADPRRSLAASRIAQLRADAQSDGESPHAPGV